MSTAPFIPARAAARLPARLPERLPERGAAPARAFPRRDFGVPPPPPPPEPSFGPRDLAEAREDGFRQGHAAGRDAGLAEAEAARRTMETEALGHIAAALAAGHAAAADAAEQAAAALAGALVAAMHAAMPELLRRSALGEAEAMLARILPGLSREKLVVVEVFAALAPGVAGAVARLSPDRDGRVEVASRDDFAVGEVRVRWDGGHAMRRPAEIWRGILDVLTPALGDAGPADAGLAGDGPDAGLAGDGPDAGLAGDGPDAGGAGDGVNAGGFNDGGRHKETGHGH